jgi:exodeoxyribonuclease V alpha subunit
MVKREAKTTDDFHIDLKDPDFGYFSPMDHHAGVYFASFAREHQDEVSLAAKLVSRCLREGHVCVNLDEMAGRTVYSASDGREDITCPNLKVWLQALSRADCVGRPGDFKPLILDDRHRLYFQRYQQYEQDIAEYILRQINAGTDDPMDAQFVREKIQFYFPESDENGIDWQKTAAAAALLQRFLVITGSPGTGKTTTLTRLMVFLLDVFQADIRIALAAPTGKAAIRLQEAVKKTKEAFAGKTPAVDRIPDTAMTLHRLLGTIVHSPYFRRHEGNLLPYDLVVIDEASMVDLPMMAKLMRALPPRARLILLGDKDQLASVDAGYVLGSICEPFQPNLFTDAMASRIADLSGEKPPSTEVKSEDARVCVIELQKNYRFSGESGIGCLSRAVKNGDAGEVYRLLTDDGREDILYREMAEGTDPSAVIRQAIVDHYGAFLEEIAAGSVWIEKIFERFEEFRVLCALRVGLWGSRNLNRVIEKILTAAGSLEAGKILYPGRPVMITRNHYHLNLFNGDVGIVVRDVEDNGRLRVFFRNQKGDIRKLSPGRLPEHETAWAMTVHKSQGSEYDHVLLVLSDSDSVAVTRELLYTGVTRARNRVDIRAGKEVVSRAVNRPIQRWSGLADAVRCGINKER